MSKVLKIKEDMKIALKEKNKDKLTALRMLISSLEKEKVEKKLDSVEKLSDSDVDVVIQKEIKKLDQELEGLEKAGRDVSSVVKQKESLLVYLPKQLSEEEVKTYVETKVKELGIESKKQMGQLMGILSKELKGKADMKLVSTIVNNVLK